MTLSGQLAWRIDHSTKSFAIHVASEPASVALVAVAAVHLMRRHRHHA